MTKRSSCHKPCVWNPQKEYELDILELNVQCTLLIRLARKVVQAFRHYTKTCNSASPGEVPQLINGGTLKQQNKSVNFDT